VTLDIAMVLAILAVAFLLFVTEWLRMDVVALLVLGALAVTGLVPPEQTLSGFSNPAVITVWAMFMLSAGLTQTGVANIIGQHTLRLAGRGETRMVVVVMIAAGVLSAFMNNIGVAALMLPVVMDVARRSNIPPSRLLMPLAFATLLGGLTTLIGTPPNLIASQALDDAGLPPFRLFDFTPVGGVVMVAGVAFVTLWARRWLPVRDPATETAAESKPDPEGQYGLQERSAVLRICDGSPLEGMTLGESRLGAATGLNVYAVVRDGKPHPAPDRFFVLQSGDHLVVQGRLDRFEELRAWQAVMAEEAKQPPEELFPDSFSLAEFIIPTGSELVGRTLGEVAFRAKHHVLVLAIRRGAELRRKLLANYQLQADDRLLVEAPRKRIDGLGSSGYLEEGEKQTRDELAHSYGLQHQSLTIRLEEDSVLVGQSVTESRLADALGMMVIAILRDEKNLVWPGRHERLLPGDRLVTRGRPEDVDVFLGLQCLEVQQGIASETAQATASLSSERATLVEVTLSPRSLLARKNLRQIDFRARYGLQVLAILRGGKVIRSNLRDRKLKFGDVLLLHGERDNAARLAMEPDFLVLSKSWQKTINTARAPIAALIMVAVLIPVLFGWLPIAVTAVIGATLMVVTGCLSMEEAYRAVEWRAIFLIAGMLPLGTAMQTSGTANLLAEGMLSLAAPLGPWGVIIGLYLVTAAATMIIPTAALVVLMVPIALKASAAMGISPHTVIMAIAIAASASFTSPISHPANLLVMGPGGYRFSDYLKTGVPLTILIAIVALLVLPWVWPLNPAP
jgi:di/tricarboxylate transporter